jgi:ribonuclease P protein component
MLKLRGTTENPSLTSLRSAVIVSQKVAKSAVVRNRQRRRIYALLRPYREKAEGNLIVRLTPGAEALDYGQLAAHLEQCLRQLTMAA